MNSIRDISGFCVYVVGVCFPLFRTPDIVEKFLLIIQPLICKKKKRKCVERENKRRNRRWNEDGKEERGNKRRRAKKGKGIKMF